MKAAGLPNITFDATERVTGANSGVFTQGIFSNADTFENGALKMKNVRNQVTSGGGWFEVGSLDFDASRCSEIYGGSTTVQPPSLCLIPQIRF